MSETPPGTAGESPVNEGAGAPNDRYAIHLAKTAIREGYNSGDVPRVLSAYADGYQEMAEGLPSFGGAEARTVLQARLTALFADYDVRLVPLTAAILLWEETAFSYGWHESTVRARSGGEAHLRRTRYAELWRKDSDGAWRIHFSIDNLDQPSVLLGEMLGGAALRCHRAVGSGE